MPLKLVQVKPRDSNVVLPARVWESQQDHGGRKWRHSLRGRTILFFLDGKKFGEARTGREGRATMEFLGLAPGPHTFEAQESEDPGLHDVAVISIPESAGSKKFPTSWMVDVAGQDGKYLIPIQVQPPMKARVLFFEVYRSEYVEATTGEDGSFVWNLQFRELRHRIKILLPGTDKVWERTLTGPRQPDDQKGEENAESDVK